MQKVGELRQIGLERLEKLFRIFSSFPRLSFKIFELFYFRREPLAIPDIFLRVRAGKKRRVRYVVKKLLELEILEKVEPPAFAKRKSLNYYVISRLGLDLYKLINSFNLTPATVKALGMPHSFEVLSALTMENIIISWSILRDRFGLSESSLARVLDSLKDATLISRDQEGGYCLTTKGKIATETLSKLNE